MLKILVLVVVLAFFGIQESNAATIYPVMEWVEGSAINIAVGPETALYCKLEDNRHRIVFDGFGPCRLTLARVTKDFKGLWLLWYGAPGQIFVQKRSFNVNVLQATVESQPRITSTVERIKSTVLITCSVPEEHEVKTCMFRDPHGYMFMASRNEKKDNSYRSFAEANNCTLQLFKPLYEVHGIWRCAVNTTQDIRYSFFNITRTMLNPEDSNDFIYPPDLRAKTTAVTDWEGAVTKLFCSIDATLRYCYYRSPNGTIINLSPSTSSADYEYFGNGFDAGECGIRIKNLQRSDNGRWTCNVGLTNYSREQSDYIRVNVINSMIVSQRWQGQQIVVRFSLFPERPLEYCRFVRSDGEGFNSQNVPQRYISLSNLKWSTCELGIPLPSIQDQSPWTVIAKVVGEDEELAVTTIPEPRPSRGISNSIALILWFTLGTVFIILILMSTLPKKNRKWTAQTATRIRKSFRKQPQLQVNVANVPNHHTTQRPVSHHIHNDILTDLPPKL